MALAATFTANFGPFETELAKAVVSLEDFVPKVGNVNKSLQGLAASFSGQNIIQDAQKMAAAVDAVGGASALTAKEQARVNATVQEAIEKYQKLGKDVPPDLQKLADETAKVKTETEQADQKASGWSTTMGAVASAIGNFVANALTGMASKLTDLAQQALDFGGNMTDLSLKTGVSTSAMQAFQFAAQQNGNTIDQVATAIAQMSKRLVGGDGAAVEALDKLGLSMSALRQLKPEDAFTTMATAISTVPDPMERSAIAMALFGRSGAELLPTLTSDFAATTAEASRLGLIVEEETIAALDAMGDAIDRMKGQAFAGIINELGPFVTLMMNMAQGSDDTAVSVDDLSGTIISATPGIGGFADVWDMVKSAVDLANLAMSDVRGPIGDVDAAIAKMRPQVAAAAQVALDGDAAFQLLTQQLKESEQAHTAAASAAKKHQDELDKLTGADKLKGATDLANNIKQVGIESVLAAGNAKMVNDKMTEAITIATNQGKDVPLWWVEIAIQTAGANKELSTYTRGLGNMVSAFPPDPSVFVPPPAVLSAANTGLKELHGWIAGLPTEQAAASFEEFGKKTAEASKTAGAELKAWSEALISAVTDAVQGGGSIVGAFALAAAAELQRSLGDTIDGLGSKVSTGLADTLTSATGVVQGFALAFTIAEQTGSKALGALIGGATAFMESLQKDGDIVKAAIMGGIAAIGAIFADAEKKVNDTRDAFVAAHGGLHALNVKATEAGVSLKSLLDADNPKKYEAAVKELEAAFQAFQERLAVFDQDLQKTLATGSLMTRALRDEMIDLADKAKLDPEIADQQAMQSIYNFIIGSTQQITDGFSAAVQSMTAFRGETGLTGTEVQQFGALAVAAFNAALAAGASLPDALAAMKPGLVDLADAADRLGQVGAFSSLTDLVNLADQFGPLLDSVGQFGQAITGLSNLQLLDANTFAGFAEAVTQAFQEMVAGGATAEQAMKLLQPQLQLVWELNEDLGVSLSGATADLYDQAFAAGLVGDSFRDSGDVMMKAVNALLGRLDALILALGGTLPVEAQRGAAAVNAELASISAEEPLQDVADKAWWVKDSIANSIDVGVTAVNADLATVGGSGEGAFQRVADKAWWAKDSMANSISRGVTDVNKAFEEFDAAGIQDLTADIAWEFEYGIPNASRGGVTKIGQHMGDSERFVELVKDMAEEVSDVIGIDLPDSSQDAAQGIAQLKASGVTDLQAIEEAVQRILFGRSPGGFKDIIAMSGLSAQAIRGLRHGAVAEFALMESAVKSYAHDLDLVTDGRSAHLSTSIAVALDKQREQRPIVIHNHTYLDGREVAYATVQHMPDVLDDFGVGR